MNRKKISIILFIVMILSELFAKDLIVLRVIAIVAVVFCVFTIGADLMMVLEFMGVIG